jgi:hypothetical protein
MHDDFIANTTHGSTIHAVPACGTESGVAVYKGNQGGDGTGSTLDKKECSDGNQGHQRSGSTSSRRASLAQSPNGGDDFESVTQTDGMGPIARGRGGIQGVPDGADPDTECSTESSWERRPDHWGQARLVLPSGEARAYSARFDTSLLSTRPSSGGRDRQHGPQHGSTLELVREGPAGGGPAETRGSRPRSKQYKYYYATIPARRT